MKILYPIEHSKLIESEDIMHLIENIEAGRLRIHGFTFFPFFFFSVTPPSTNEGSTSSICHKSQ